LKRTRLLVQITQLELQIEGKSPNYTKFSHLIFFIQPKTLCVSFRNSILLQKPALIATV